MIEKAAARIAGRGAVKIPVGALDEGGGVSALAVLEIENGRKRSRGRNPKDHPVKVAYGTGGGGAVEVAVGTGNENGRIRLALGGCLKIVNARENPILSEPQNGTVTRTGVKRAEIDAVKGAVWKTDLREGGEGLGEGS